MPEQAEIDRIQTFLNGTIPPVLADSLRTQVLDDLQFLIDCVAELETKILFEAKKVRDDLAIAALQGLLAHGPVSWCGRIAEVGEVAYAIAEDALKQRNVLNLAGGFAIEE